MISLRLPERPGTVAFDLDGTLLDSSLPVHTAWEVALTGMGLPALPFDQLDRVIGPPMQLVARELLSERGRGDDGAYDEVVARFRDAITAVEVEQAIAYPGAVAVVRRLAEDGRRLVVVTSKPRQSAARVVPALGIDGLFVHLEAPDVERPEPKTVTMGRAVERLDLDPADTAMVGDRHHDVTAAADHGIATIGVTWAAHASADELRSAGAATLVHAPDELLPALGWVPGGSADPPPDATSSADRLLGPTRHGPPCHARGHGPDRDDEGRPR